MAKANREVEVVERIIYEEEDVLVLTLSLEEAVALKCVLQKVGGNEIDSIRALTSPISDALTTAGVKWQPCDEVCEGRRESIVFLDDTRTELRY